MKFIKIIFIIFLALNANGKNIAIDNINLIKIKKLISKEEHIAIAYKKYLIEKGDVTNNLELLINEKEPVSNYFRKSISLDDQKAVIYSNIKAKSNLYDYYMSNDNRKHTRASSLDNKISIILNKKEKFIFKNHANIIISKTSNPTSKYYLEKGVLSWYDENSAYKYSITKSNDLIIDNSITIFNENSFIKTAEFIALFKDKNTGIDKNILYVGQKLFHHKNAKALEYVNLDKKVRKVGKAEKDIGKTIVQFSRRGGGIIINGDVYTWGNNYTKSTGINKNIYEAPNRVNSHKPIINVLVRVKAKSYVTNMPKGYYSSALRPKFVDFFSSVYHSTCAISLKGELYCNGQDNAYSYPSGDINIDTSRTGVMYRSRFFTGIDGHKANKIFANNSLWLILSNGVKDGNGVKNADIYRIGYDFAAFAGGPTRIYDQRTVPSKIEMGDIKFRDITYSLTIGYRKIAALSDHGFVYLWGVEPKNTNYLNCNENISYNGATPVFQNICTPNKISNIKFKSITGSMRSFVAITFDDKYYKIYQEKDANSRIIINTISLDNVIKNYTDSVNSSNSYNSKEDKDIISVDVSSKIINNVLVPNKGVVWVNSYNELKGDYFTKENREDSLFIDAVKEIKWKKIKVIEDGNAICGIDIYNQMYCWGIMSYYRNNSYAGNTFMIPVFNTNLYSLNKDYILAEGFGAEANNNSSNVTNMTDDIWTIKDHGKGPFFVRYPTYIGGFNYDFIFK